MQKGDGFQVAPQLRKMIVFAPHDLLKDAPFTRLDLITCRNLLIYQANERELLASCLRRRGIEVATASNGREAFDLLHE